MQLALRNPHSFRCRGLGLYAAAGGYLGFGRTGSPRGTPALRGAVFVGSDASGFWTKAQNAAALFAMRAAFEEFLGGVDPKELEQRFERVGKRGVFGGQSKAKYWDLYTELFAGLAQRPSDGFPHVFTETFTKAYESRMRALVPPKRSAFGADRDEPNNPNGHAVGDP